MSLLDELDQQTTPSLLNQLDQPASLLSQLDQRDIEEAKKSNFQRVLEQVNRTGYGGVNLVRNAVQSVQGRASFDPVQAFTRGASLKDTPTFGEVLTKDLGFNDFLTSVGVQPSSTTGRVATGVLGFAGDVLADPLTYVPAGVFVKIAQGAGRAMGVARGVKALAQTEMAQQAGRALIPGFGLKQAGFGRLYEESLHYQGLLQKRQADVIQDTLDLAKGFSPQEASTIRRILDEPGFLTEGVEPKLVETAEKMREKFAAFADIEQQAGILPRIREFYFPHIRKDVEQTIGSATTALRKITPGFAKPRTIEESITSVNHALAREFFEENAFKGLGIRGLAHARAVTANEFLTKTLTEYGRPAKLGDSVLSGEGVYVARDLFKRAPEQFLKQNLQALSSGNELVEIGTEAAQHLIGSTKGAEVWVLPKEIADHLNTFRKTVQNQGEMRTFLKGYDGVLNLWKGYQTGANLAFHSRNAISNYWLNYLRHGAKAFDPAANHRALGVLLANSDAVREKLPLFAQRLEQSVIQTPNGPLSYKQVFGLMQEYGIAGRGWVGTDIPMLIDQQLSVGLAGTAKKLLTRMNPASQHNALLTMGRAVGQNVENHARALSFLLGLERGEDVVTAAMQTRKYLFDYAELTGFEKQVMKRIVPFYTWMRKNIPLQFEQMLRQPSKYTTLTKAEGEIERGVRQPTEMPDWVRASVPIFVGETPDHKALAFSLRSYIPAADIESIIGGSTPLGSQRVPEIIRTLLTSVSPLIREPVEQAVNYDTFFNRPIEYFPGERRTVLGQSVPNRLARLIPRPAQDVSRLVGDQGRESQSGSLPFPARAARFVTGGRLTAVDEDRQRKRSKFERDRLERQAKFSLKLARQHGDTANIEAAERALTRIRESR